MSVCHMVCDMVTIFKEYKAITSTADENVKSNLLLKEEKWRLRTSIP